jgi:hypothetical protein
MDGSGKYEGMTANGEYRPIGNVPRVLAGGFKSCNHHSGSCKFKVTSQTPVGRCRRACKADERFLRVVLWRHDITTHPE